MEIIEQTRRSFRNAMGLVYKARKLILEIYFYEQFKRIINPYNKVLEEDDCMPNL